MLRPRGEGWQKRGEGKRDSRNEIANNGRGEREGERDEGGRVTCMHRIGEGRRRRSREACLNRDGVESSRECTVGYVGQCAGLNGKTAKNEKFYEAWALTIRTGPRTGLFVM